MFAIALQRAPVAADHPARERLDIAAVGEVLDRHDQRRVADDPRLAIDDRRELAERPQAVLRARLGDVLLHHLAALGARRALKLGEQRLGIDPRVPQIERLHRRETADRLAIRPRHRQIHAAALIGVKAEVASGDREARDQPLEIPFERARQRLVEVVDVEHKPPIGRGESTEVRQVRIAAQLHVQTRPRRTLEVCRHQVRRATVERKRRDHHPPVADRHQLRHPRRRLLLQQLDRVTATRRRQPLAMQHPVAPPRVRPYPAPHAPRPTDAQPCRSRRTHAPLPVLRPPGR